MELVGGHLGLASSARRVAVEREAWVLGEVGSALAGHAQPDTHRFLQAERTGFQDGSHDPVLGGWLVLSPWLRDPSVQHPPPCEGPGQAMRLVGMAFHLPQLEYKRPWGL